MTCGDCLHMTDRQPKPHGDTNGLCKSRPPQVVVLDGQVKTRWPMVWAHHEGCGDGEPG